jgi:hypothetical protein
VLTCKERILPNVAAQRPQRLGDFKDGVEHRSKFLLIKPTYPSRSKQGDDVDELSKQTYRLHAVTSGEDQGSVRGI